MFEKTFVGSYITFDEPKGVQLCAVVASEVSKCEEYGLWLSSTHSTTRM